MTNTHVRNILFTLELSTPAEIESGMSWYDGAHTLALELSPADPWRGAGVIAAFSPQRSWPHNVATAQKAFETGIATGHTGTMNSQAQRILDGEFALDVLNGDKVRAFASAIADPANSTIATIDRHAHDVAMGRVFSDKERKIGKVLFRELSAAYVESANWAGMSVAQLQAVTWVTWKRMKGHTE